MSTARLLVWVLVFPLSAWAQTFQLRSQNTLHLGWNANPAKPGILQAQFATAQVTILQEVMNTTPAVLNGVRPGGQLIIASGVKGHSTYKEAYVFLVDPTYAPSAVFDYPAPGFSRPPSAITVTPPGGTTKWIVDFHAVWGKNAALRQAEAMEMANVVHWLNGVLPAVTEVVIGGDWNLPTTDAVAFGPLTALGFTGAPNAPSSLTPAGAPSSPYDHFFWSPAGLVTNAVVVPGAGGNPYWRTTVSDHLGVTCDVHQ